MITKAYACYNNDETIRVNSSSGGIYPLLAARVISEGGVVFAACYDNELNVKHQKLIKQEEIFFSQGSKYVCSTLGDTFLQIIEIIKQEKKVLFVGTPCQCAGLISFFDLNNLGRKNIILVDCVCHGVPGKVSWNAYKKSLEKKNFILRSVNMRDKCTGWTKGNYSWSLADEKGHVVVMPKSKNPFMKGMLSNLTIRPSCFDCKFKGINRITDITLGDYWGIWNHLPEMDDNKGTSLVLIHSEQGMNLFNNIKDKITWADAVIDKAVNGNRCIVDSTKYNPKREAFFARLHRGEDFVSIVEDLTKVNTIERIKAKFFALLHVIKPNN